MDMSKMGIVISGLVSDVQSYTQKSTGEVKHKLRLFVPGSDLLSINLADGSDLTRFSVGSPAKLKIAFNQGVSQKTNKPYFMLNEVPA